MFSSYICNSLKIGGKLLALAIEEKFDSELQ